MVAFSARTTSGFRMGDNLVMWCCLNLILPYFLRANHTALIPRFLALAIEDHRGVFYVRRFDSLLRAIESGPSRARLVGNVKSSLWVTVDRRDYSTRPLFWPSHSCSNRPGVLVVLSYSVCVIVGLCRLPTLELECRDRLWKACFCMTL